MKGDVYLNTVQLIWGDVLVMHPPAEFLTGHALLFRAFKRLLVSYITGVGWICLGSLIQRTISVILSQLLHQPEKANLILNTFMMFSQFMQIKYFFSRNYILYNSLSFGVKICRARIWSQQKVKFKSN